MRVFVTGASGFIGSVVVKDLISAGHKVLGLVRSELAAAKLVAAGAEAQLGDVQDLDSLRRGAGVADGVIHTAFIHDFAKFKEVCEVDRRAIEAMGSVLAGSDRPFIVTSGTAITNTVPKQLATEDNLPVTSDLHPRGASEEAAAAVAGLGVNVSVVRLAQIHDPLKQGLITYLVPVAREKGVSVYVGDGSNRWPACHVTDTARLYRLALEKGTPGAIYHAVTEEGVPLRDIADVLGRGLKIPVVSMSPQEAAAHFGWLTMFAGKDLPASSALTRQKLDWSPTGPGLLEDLEQMKFV